MATDTELKRGEEVFKSFLQYAGREVALLPYLKKYSEEDNCQYSFTILLKYMNIYKKSELISKEDKDIYNKLRSISKTTIKARGKEICDTLMQNKFQQSSLQTLAIKYAKEDNRYLPYSASTLSKMRQYYLNEAPHDYLKEYQTIFELSQRSTTEGLDFGILKTIINFDNPVDALAYMKENNINYISFQSLYKVYFKLNPDDKKVQTSVNNIEALILSENRAANKEKHMEIAQKNHDMKIERMKNILNNYINSGKDNLEECIREGGITPKTFYQNFNKEKKNIDNKEFQSIYQKYLEVDASFFEERKKLAETLLDYYQNGVYYGQENRPFSLYDYYSLTDKSNTEIIKILRAHLSLGLASSIGIFINNLTITNKFDDRKTFVDYIKYRYPKVDELERDAIIDYIEAKNWPYSLTLFKDIWERLTDGLIVLPNHQDKNPSNLYK